MHNFPLFNLKNPKKDYISTTFYALIYSDEQKNRTYCQEIYSSKENAVH